MLLSVVVLVFVASVVVVVVLAKESKLTINSPPLMKLLHH
jgi:hypothetical protein